MWNAIIYLLSFAFIVFVSWGFAWFLAMLHENKQLKSSFEQLQKTHAAEKLVWEEEQENIQIDYSIMAGLIEEHTTQLADVHQELDTLAGRIDQLGNIHIKIGPMLMPMPEYDYTGPDERDSTAPTLPLPLIDWVRNVEGIDEL